MPTYGYQCTQCNHEFSVFQNMKDDPIKICPECAGAVKRLLYPVGIVFKGSGWYINDSRKPDTSEGSAPAADKKSDGGEKASESKSEPKSESKDSSPKSEPAAAVKPSA